LDSPCIRCGGCNPIPPHPSRGRPARGVCGELRQYSCTPDSPSSGTQSLAPRPTSLHRRVTDRPRRDSTSGHVSRIIASQSCSSPQQTTDARCDTRGCRCRCHRRRGPTCPIGHPLPLVSPARHPIVVGDERHRATSWRPDTPPAVRPAVCKELDGQQLPAQLSARGCENLPAHVHSGHA
jgi:hypothetical protein